jgi:Disulfide bond isomerase protein N-terminus
LPSPHEPLIRVHQRSETDKSRELALQHREKACASTSGSGLQFVPRLWWRIATSQETASRGLNAHHGVVSATLLILSTLLLSTPLHAQEAQIRKNLPARLPGFPAIDRVIKTPIPGLYEVNVDTEVYYTDAKGDHLIQGSILAPG